MHSRKGWAPVRPAAFPDFGQGVEPFTRLVSRFSGSGLPVSWDYGFRVAVILAGLGFASVAGTVTVATFEAAET